MIRQLYRITRSSPFVTPRDGRAALSSARRRSMLTGVFQFERVSRRVEDNVALPGRRGRTRAAHFISHLSRVCWCLVFGVWCFVAHAGTVALSVREPAGLSRTAAPVTSGIPFPMGALRTNSALQLFDSRGNPMALQHRTTATWRDGSVKWTLLDFQTDIAARETRGFQLKWSDAAAGATRSALFVEDVDDVLWVNTGVTRFSISKKRFGVFEDRLQQSVAFGKEFSNIIAQVLPPEEVVVEERGPVRVAVKVAGWISDGSTNKLLKYVVRVHAFANSRDVVLEHTVMHLSANVKMLWLKDLSLTLRTDAQRYALGGGTTRTGSLTNGDVTLTQLKESAYTVSGAGGAATGLRAKGWFEAGNAFIGVQDFWQQFPKAVTIASNSIRLALYPAEAGEPWDMDAGLAKKHRILISLGGPPTTGGAEAKFRAFDQPLFAQTSPQWYCDSGVFGDLAPFDFDLFPDYETLTEASGDKFIKSLATGIRNWGDVYYGGPYKGKNSYMNLEYDVPHNFILQFARTGQRKYLDAARRMAQHQADIDTNHKTGWQWKHSPRHTEIQAEFGHTFTRGLLENYYLTGDRSTFEAAVTLGNYFIKQIRNPRETGNERQIGWGLISLLPVYEATWDAKYLEAVRTAVDRLAAEQEPGGKFKIRWDNRIAFFNGIAATGFIYYERATGDEKAAEAALKTIRRTKGFYPEYAGRTLEALAWAYQRTQDPDYLDLLKLTYETTMEKVISWNVMELGAPTIFTAHTLPFLEKSGLVTKPKDALNLTAAQFASENGMHVHHVPAGEGDVWFKTDSTEPFQLAIIRKGVWKADATAALYDPAGKIVKEWKLPRESKIWQRETFRAQPSVSGIYRLALRSTTVANAKAGSFVTWDVATSRAIPAVLQAPDFAGLQFVTPFLFTAPQGDTDRIELELVGEGEGFKKAVIYDPDGNVAGTMEAFVDLGDTGRYTYKLSAKIPPPHMNGIWRVSLQDVSLTKMSGLAPYFSTSERAFFRPDR